MILPAHDLQAQLPDAGHLHFTYSDFCIGKALPYRRDCPDSKLEDLLAVHGNVVKGSFGGGMRAMEGFHAIPAILCLQTAWLGRNAASQEPLGEA